MKDRTRKPELGSAEPMDRAARPSEAHVSASQAFASTFDRIREESDELLRLERTARSIFAARPPVEFEGLSRLLDVLLPRAVAPQRRIARALAFEQSVLERMRSSSVDPFEVNPGPLAALARAITLDYATFWLLAQRDHDRLASRSGARARSARTSRDIEAAFRSAWERDVLDDASSS